MVGDARGDRSDDRAWMPAQAPARGSGPTEVLAGYTDLVEIGRGGDSVVYRAREVALNREVAIKVLLLDDEETVARFEREIEITVDLGRQHPNIMTVLATGTTEAGRPAIVMDLYERGSLDQRVHQVGPIPPAEVVAIGCVLADALAFAHEHGVLHRDVKPQNVMVLPTSYVLGDFGIARLADSEHTASAERFTVRHASPQILDGMAPTAADDIWSLGSTLFTLLDGRPPFAAEDPHDDTVLAYLRRARTEPHRLLEVTGDHAGLVTVIERALRKDPAERWPDARAMQAALEQQRASVQAWSPEAPAAPPAPAPDEPAPVRDEPAPAALREEPADAEPTPVALSALAHGAAAPQADAEPTGTLHRADGGRVPTDDVVATDEPGEGEGQRSNRRLLLVLGAAALVIGVTLGLVGGWLRQDDGSAEPPVETPSSGIPSLDVPPDDDDPQPLRTDREIVPIIVNMRHNGTSVDLEWRSRGEVSGFVVSQTFPEEQWIDRLAPETTTYTVEGVDPTVERFCVLVTAIGRDGAVGSAKRCATTP